jgi:hypothetical protein
MRRGSLLSVLAIVFACGAPAKDSARVGSSERCPDLSKADEITSFDFSKEFGVSRGEGDKLRAALLAAMELGALGDRLDAELGIACSKIAQDLGMEGDWRTGNDACAAALKALEDARTKLGPKARIELVVGEPVCQTELALATRCASLCDSSLPADKLKAECTQKIGRCEGLCTGACSLAVPGKCEGSCNGTCDGTLKGKCGGRCVGTCDGKRVSGPCSGVCVGACERGPANGECKGTCAGTCKLAKPGTCNGTCSGACSVELIEARCGGEFSGSGVSPACRAQCDLAVMNHTDCGTPAVGAIVSGAKDQAGDATKAAVDRSFPALLKILHEVGDDGVARVERGQAVVDGARASLAEQRKGERLEACFGARLKTADAVRAITLGLTRGIAVRDAVTK